MSPDTGYFKLSFASYASQVPQQIPEALGASVLLQSIGSLIFASTQRLPLLGMAVVATLVDAFTRPLFSKLATDSTVANQAARLVVIPLFIGSCAHALGIGFNIAGTILINAIAAIILAKTETYNPNDARFWVVLR